MFDHYNTFYAETPLEHRSEQIINVIGNFVVTRLNEDFGKTSGIDDFFELSGNDKHEFWFHYSDSAEACLRELAKKRLEVFNSMSNQTLRSIFIEKDLRLAKKPRITDKLATHRSMIKLSQWKRYPGQSLLVLTIEGLMRKGALKESS